MLSTSTPHESWRPYNVIAKQATGWLWQSRCEDAGDPSAIASGRNMPHQKSLKDPAGPSALPQDEKYPTLSIDSVALFQLALFRFVFSILVLP